MVWRISNLGSITSGDKHLLAQVHKIACKLQHGHLLIIAPNGSQQQFEGRSAGPDAVLKLNTLRAVRRFVIGGSLGFAEAYLDGDWDSPDLPVLLEFLVRNEEALSLIHI